MAPPRRPRCDQKCIRFQRVSLGMLTLHTLVVASEVNFSHSYQHMLGQGMLGSPSRGHRDDFEPVYLDLVALPLATSALGYNLHCDPHRFQPEGGAYGRGEAVLCSFTRLARVNPQRLFLDFAYDCAMLGYAVQPPHLAATTGEWRRFLIIFNSAFYRKGSKQEDTLRKRQM